MEIKYASLPSIEPGCRISALVCALMDHYFDKLSFKNEAVQLTAAAHFSRAQECIGAAHRLLKHGDLLAAYTVMRSALEANYCLAAISVDPEQAFGVMKHSYLKESLKEFRCLLESGYKSIKDGTSIEAHIEVLNERKREFDGVGSSIFDLARIGNKAGEFVTYRFLSSFAHPASLISAVNHQLGPHDKGPSIRIGHKDVITSKEFMVNAGIGLDCLKNAANYLEVTLCEQFTELESKVNAAMEEIAR